MICYKCDACGDIHYSIGKMNNVKIAMQEKLMLHSQTTVNLWYVIGAKTL